ncbi:Cell division protein FtsL [Microbacterium oxydans]|uniref:Cell division protein FtsL n=1 Tax=Microbacterium oxydans TaxID=82380 RepID=A0A0F0L4D3_9MICO|nr:hypothetical protein [Microbacterium oxydans]KJL27549.1 Cell division protein FtsL [Microbacterium oxydans]CAH0166939.1 Cell division protein FtsL [Microbacterium oxydans]
MSLNATVRQPAQPLAPTRTPERRLRPVAEPRPRRKPKLAYALVALGGALAIGAVQIALSLAITQDSFALASLSSQQRELNLQTHALQEELTGLNSPQVLATEASKLGMVVAGSPSYLRLSDGMVFGVGAGADWTSTVDPSGAGAVSNALITAPPAETPVNADGTPTTTQDLPPAITDGLPSPTTR